MPFPVVPFAPFKPRLGEHVTDIFDVNATANDVFKKTQEQTSGCYTKLLQMAPAEGVSPENGEALPLAYRRVHQDYTHS